MTVAATMIESWRSVAGTAVSDAASPAHPVTTRADVLPRRFLLERLCDPTGVSGTGVVAWGTVYPNGKVSLAWCGSRPSLNMYESLADVEAIHGHDGSTRIVVFDEPTVDERLRQAS